MENLKNTDGWLYEEMEKYKKEIEIVRNTEGYPFLTENQQQIIELSLYVQNRAFRDMVSCYPTKAMYDWIYKPRPELKYPYSRLHIRNWYCHQAIYSLENGKFSLDNPPDIHRKFFDAQFFQIKFFAEAKLIMENFGYPSVVHLSNEDNNRHGEDTMFHSFLVLGHNPDGDLIGWDKEGLAYPYRIVKIEDIFDYYGGVYYWGIRKLRDKQVVVYPWD